MQQESTDNSYFTVHWNSSGKPRTVFSAGKSKAQNFAEFKLIEGEEDDFGGQIGVIKAASPIAAYRIAQEHTLCIFMGIRKCKHITLTGGLRLGQNGAK